MSLDLRPYSSQAYGSLWSGGDAGEISWNDSVRPPPDARRCGAS